MTLYESGGDASNTIYARSSFMSDSLRVSSKPPEVKTRIINIACDRVSGRLELRYQYLGRNILCRIIATSCTFSS